MFAGSVHPARPGVRPRVGVAPLLLRCTPIPRGGGGGGGFPGGLPRAVTRGDGGVAGIRAAEWQRHRASWRRRQQQRPR